MAVISDIYHLFICIVVTGSFKIQKEGVSKAHFTVIAGTAKRGK
jgi:hypothetical protein